jgi:antitoxin MazE
MPLTRLQIRDYNVITYYGEDELMKTRLVRIGNSRGIRLPKPLIAQAGLTDEVELHLRDGAIVIERSSTPRSGWAEAAKEMHERDEDSLLDSPPATQFDEKEWEW